MTEIVDHTANLRNYDEDGLLPPGTVGDGESGPRTMYIQRWDNDNECWGDAFLSNDKELVGEVLMGDLVRFVDLQGVATRDNAVMIVITSPTYDESKGILSFSSMLVAGLGDIDGFSEEPIVSDDI